MQRRKFLQACIASGAFSVLPPRLRAATSVPTLRFLRPPGAVSEEQFVERCIRCGKCGEACPNRCIEFFGFENGLNSRDTPYIIPREQACILCMKCGEACPSGAIQPVPREAEAIMQRVKMGHARVDEQLCLSFQGKTCGVCYRACPLQDVAIVVGRLEQPHVLGPCVGCGLCERSCIQIPQAIRVFPSQTRPA